MKKSDFSLYLSLIAMFVFLISSVFCYIKITRKYEVLNQVEEMLVFKSEEQNTQMNVVLDNLDVNYNNKEVSSMTASIDIYYKNADEKSREFAIMMRNFTDYEKTIGVDGISFKEFTYEISLEDNIIVPETEIPSFVEGSTIMLASQYILPQDDVITYDITIRFYTNKLDQSNLLGKKIRGEIFVQ